MANITQIDLGAITPIPKGDYSLTTNYERLNLVVYNGSSWIRTEKEPYVVGSIPQTGSLYWQLNASGVSEIPDASLTVKGITKLSNATNSVDETVAATSRAVKSAYDIGSTAVSNATTANNTANSALSIANSTKAITDLVSLTAIAGGIPKADSTGKIDKGWIDPESIPKYDICEFYYFRNPTLKSGMQPAQGGLITNAATRYPEAWAYLQTTEGQQLCKSEAEWQAMTRATWATLADGTKVGWDGIGGAPFYVQNLAAGTLRMPDLRGMYPEAAGFDSLGVGDVHGDMIRNLDGSFGGWSAYPATGAFIADVTSSNAQGSGGYGYAKFSLHASRVVPVGNANKPRAWGALACCYLGQQASY